MRISAVVAKSFVYVITSSRISEYQCYDIEESHIRKNVTEMTTKVSRNGTVSYPVQFLRFVVVFRRLVSKML